MKGVVFTEFLDMVESKFSTDMADDIIDAADLPSKGAYTAVGTYPHAEMGKLVVALSKRSGVKAPDLLKAYGEYLFGRFHAGYPVFFEGVTDSFGFLKRIEGVVHVEVGKLYPDAELPSFETLEISPDRLHMTYRSPRCLGDFAQGLMTGCFAHYRETVALKRSDEHEGKVVKFELTRHAA
ncbi:MAG: hypothetical protein FJX59_17030 [Alphaproteobacteria bacterium]|nr:hypothetical protein [Alphaproteobacteria bacterium]